MTSLRQLLLSKKLSSGAQHLSIPEKKFEMARQPENALPTNSRMMFGNFSSNSLKTSSAVLFGSLPGE